MLAALLLPSETPVARLRSFECRTLEGLGPLNTAEFWITDWVFLFTVPVEGPDDRCGEADLSRVIEMINAARPRRP